MSDSDFRYKDFSVFSKMVDIYLQIIKENDFQKREAMFEELKQIRDTELVERIITT